MRAQLESLAARLAIPRLAEADLDELDGLLREMREAADAGDFHAEAVADAAFHGRLVELSANTTLQRVWRTLEPYSRTYITIVAPGADRRAIADHHAPVIEALRRRDPDLVTDVLRRHFDDAAAVIAGAAERQAATPDGRPPGPTPAARRGSAARASRRAPAPAVAAAERPT